MRGTYDRLWVSVAIVLSVVVVAVGWPAFQRRFGFPLSLVWMLAVVAGVWLTYVVRACAWGSWGRSGKTGGDRSRP
jgi:hypothetical protein